jgi:hypothetical protein
MATKKKTTTDKVAEALNAIPDDYIIDEVVSEYNSRGYAKVLLGGKSAVMVPNEVEDPISKLKQIKYSYYRPHELRNFLSHERVKLGKRVVAKFDVWSQDRNCSHYSEVTFKPWFKPENKPRLKEKEFNIWTGYAVEPVNHNIVYPYLTHIIRKISYFNPEFEKWIWDWFAYNYQYPERKTDIAIVLRGTEGTGKGILSSLNLAIHGNHGSSYTQTSQVVGKFNAHHEGQVFEVYNEAMFAGNAQDNNALKGLITDLELSIERKGFDVERSVNYINAIMCTNHDWAVPAGSESRRYAVFDLNKIDEFEALVVRDFTDENGEVFKVGDSWLQYHPEEENENLIRVNNFYAEFALEVQRKEIREQYLYDMTTRPITGRKPSENAPVTEALRDQRLQTLQDDSTVSWLLSLYVDKPTILDKTSGLRYELAQGVPMKVIYDDYLNHCKEMCAGKFTRLSLVMFNKKLISMGAEKTRVGMHRDRALLLSLNSFNKLVKKLGIYSGTEKD